MKKWEKREKPLFSFDELLEAYGFDIEAEDKDDVVSDQTTNKNAIDFDSLDLSSLLGFSMFTQGIDIDDLSLTKLCIDSFSTESVKSSICLTSNDLSIKPHREFIDYSFSEKELTVTPKQMVDYSTNSHYNGINITFAA